MARSELSTLKQALRASMRERLSAIGDDEWQTRSRAVCDALLDSRRLKRASAVMVYLPTPGEVDIRPVIDGLLRHGVLVTAPRMDWEARTMAPVRITALDSGLEIRRHGVPEPVAGDAIAPETLDIILIPGLAFDLSGGRLGRGAGFYDRFLESIDRSTTWLCAVCIDEQIVERTPMTARDVRVDAIAREGSIEDTTDLGDFGES